MGIEQPGSEGGCPDGAPRPSLLNGCGIVLCVGMDVPEEPELSLIAW